MCIQTLPRVSTGCTVLAILFGLSFLLCHYFCNKLPENNLFRIFGENFCTVWMNVGRLCNHPRDGHNLRHQSDNSSQKFSALFEGFTRRRKLVSESKSMKLIHRYELEINSGIEGRVAEKTSKVVVSFYREHLDTAYQQIIADMLDYGRFDGFIGSIIGTVVLNGELVFSIEILLLIQFSGTRNATYTSGFQAELTTFSSFEQKTNDWSLALQFLGCPVRARLTTYLTAHYLDIYFP